MTKQELPIVVHIDSKESELIMEREALQEINCEILSVAVESEGEVIEAIKNATVVLNNHSPITASMVDHLPNCKLIIRYGHGYDTIDVEACTKAGIIVTNIAGSTSEEVSNHALALLLACGRKLKPLDKAMSDGNWRKVYSRETGNRIFGETVGVVGFGWIGRALARKCKSLGMNVLVHDPYIGEWLTIEYGVSLVGKTELLEKSDYVSLHIPHIKTCESNIGTHHWIDTKTLETMKSNAYLINTSRGPVVDEKALIYALDSGQIAGAGIDVFEEEPLTDNNPLLLMENVICTPHVAGSSKIGWEIIRRRVGEETARLLKGKKPSVIVNPEVMGNLKLNAINP